MTIVGRSKIDHPALGTAGGSALHASIETIYTNVGDHLGGRFNAYSSIANSAVTTIDHNFGVQFADLKVMLYTGSHPSLVRVSDPVASGWTIAATGGFLKTKIDVTAPSSGGPHTFSVFIAATRGTEKLDDLDDVNLSTLPTDGQLLIYDTGTSQWLPAYLKYKSETAAISSNTLTPTTGTNIQRITTGAADLQMIASPVAGKVYVLINDTGSDFLLKNDTGATAANRIYTGTGIDLTLKSQAAATLIYNSGVSRWIVSGGSGGGGLATSLKSTTFTASAGQHYLVDNSSSAFTGTLPAGASGSVIRFSDNSRVWASRNFTIAPASGETIDGLAANETLVCDVSGAFVQLMWNGTKWIVDTNGFAASISSGSLSGGQGLGKKNYVGNPNNATNWVTGGSSVTVATESSAANLPDQITQTTAIAITRVSGTTGYAAYRFEMDRSDYGKKFEIGFDQKTAFTTEGYQVQAFAGSVSGTYGTQLTVSTAAVTSLTGSFVSTIDMPGSTTPFIELRIIATGSSGTSPLYLNNVYFGPGITTQGAAISEWQSFTPTFTNVTVSNQGSFFRRVGSSIEVMVDVSATADATGTVQWNMSGGLTGITPDYTKLSNRQNLGSGFVAGGTLNYSISCNYTGTTGLASFRLDNEGSLDNTQPVADGGFDNNDRISFTARFVVAEWAGSGTVNLGAGAQVEYASNTCTEGVAVNTNYSGTSNFVSGPGGSLFPNISTSQLTGGAETSYLVQFQYPIQTDDVLFFEVLDPANSSTTWQPIESYAPYLAQGAARYGARIIANSNSSRAYVFFGNGGTVPSGATYAAVSSTLWSSFYSSNIKWRVRKAKASSPVGFGLAGTDGSSGLYKPGQAPGLTTGAAIPAGYVGEILTNSTSSVSMTTATTTDAGTLTLTPGVWDVVGYVLYSPAASTSITRLDIGIGTASGTGTTGLTAPSTNNIEFMAATVPGNDIWRATPIVRVNISVSTPYYLKSRSNFTVSTMTCGGYIRATRIA